jgi:hypothetical protein
LAQSTTVKLKPRTKKMLARLGNKDDTYDDIIRRIIKFYVEQNRVKS